MDVLKIQRLNMSNPQHKEILQKELRSIPYVAKNATPDKDVDFSILEDVLERLRSKDLSISFIMSDQDCYEMLLVGMGRWRIPDKNGNHHVYRIIGEKTYCQTFYECISKAVVCLYGFIKENEP